MEWSQPGVLVYMTKDGIAVVLVCMTKDGMVTAWSAGIYDQRWNGLSLECWYYMTKDGMVTAWSVGMYDQRWNGYSLEPRKWLWCRYLYTNKGVWALGFQETPL